MHLSKMDQHAACKTTHQTNKKFIMRTAGHRLAISNNVKSRNVTRCHGNQIVGDMSGTWWNVTTQVGSQSVHLYANCDILNIFKHGGRPPFWMLKILIFEHVTVIVVLICCCIPCHEQWTLTVIKLLRFFVLIFAVFLPDFIFLLYHNRTVIHVSWKLWMFFWRTHPIKLERSLCG